MASTNGLSGQPNASWASCSSSIGDRSCLGQVVCNLWPPAKALYPGSYPTTDTSSPSGQPTLTLMRYIGEDEASPT